MPFPLNAHISKPRTSKSLDPNTWLDAAFRVLAKNGVEAVRVEPLAKSLKVTKGSFYWHFKDRAALLEAMLVSWRQRATLGVIERLERSSQSPMDRIRQLLALPRICSTNARQGADIEAAIRLWGRSDPAAASAVLEIDRLRLGYIKSLLTTTQSDLAQGAAAMLIYAFMLAEASVGSALDPETCSHCERLLLDGSIVNLAVADSDAVAKPAKKRSRSIFYSASI